MPKYKDNFEEFDDDAVFTLTPKGAACISMIHANIIQEVEDIRFDYFYREFEKTLEMLGYEIVEKSEEKEKKRRKWFCRK